MRLKGFIGPAYTLESLNLEAQQCINLYPEIDEAGTGKEGEVLHLLGTPGMELIEEVGTGPIRCTYLDPQGRIFIVSGLKLHELSFSGSLWSSTEIGTLNTSSGTVKAASTLLDNGDSITVFVDGTDSYAFRNISSVETFGSFTSLGYEQVDNATHVRWLDGFFIYSNNTNQYFASLWGEFAVDPLSFASAEGDPDKIVAIITNHRDLWLLNERSCEIHSNTGNADFPFERVSGGFLEIGCIAPYSVAKVNGTILWLGRDESGQGIVYAAKGLAPQRVSTHAIEYAISTYEIDNITSADAYTYSDGGHSFYVLNFPDATWVYDLTTELWHQRAYNNEGALERHRADHHVFLPQYGIHLLGDYENNKIYKFNKNYFKDEDVNIRRIRSSPHITSGLKKVIYSMFELDMELGVGLDGGVLGTDPQVMLDWSNDGGHSWSDEAWASAGKIGEYKHRSRWRRLGSARDRIFRISISDPVKVVIIGAEIELEGGAS